MTTLSLFPWFYEVSTVQANHVVERGNSVLHSILSTQLEPEVGWALKMEEGFVRAFATWACWPMPVYPITRSADRHHTLSTLDHRQVHLSAEL